MRATWIAIVIGVGLASPAAALGANCAPPGTSGVVEYLETIPGASCSAPFPGAGSGARGSGLTPGTARALQAQGSAGLAVERLVAATGTVGQLGGRGSAAGGTSRGRGDHGQSAGSGNASARGQSLPSALVGPVAPGGSGDGSGLLVPIFVATALLLAAGIIVSRRRRIRRSR